MTRNRVEMDRLWRSISIPSWFVEAIDRHIGTVPIIAAGG